MDAILGALIGCAALAGIVCAAAIAMWADSKSRDARQELDEE